MLKEKLKQEKELSKENHINNIKKKSDNENNDNNINTIFNKTLKNTSSVLVLSLTLNYA